MRLLRIFSMSIRSIVRNPVRSLLMMLGVTIGIASLIAMASVGEATRQETMKRFKAMVGNYDVVNVVPGGSRTRGMPSLTTVEPSLTFEDARALARDTTTIAQVAETQNAFDIDVKYGSNIIGAAIYGVSANWLEMHNYFVQSGDLLRDEDIQTVSRVAVVGPDIQRELFQNEDPIGKQIRVGNVPFQIKGVLVSRGAGPGGASLDSIVFIPVTTASKRLFNRDYLTTINLQLKDPDNPEAAVQEVRTLLRDRHKLAAQVEDDFTINSQRANAERVSDVRDTLGLVLTGVAGIATLIGGTVIMSLMLIAVSERRGEIGMRRAIGATRYDVMTQFLVEAATISLMGGLLGIGLGLAGGTIAATLQELTPVILWSAIAGATALSVLVGLVFGLQPAWKAANIDPIEALRS